MGVVSAAARELIAAGVTGDALVTALERIEEANQPVRSAAADRMVRYRQRKKEASRVTHVTHGDASGSPDKEIPSTPPKEINPSRTLASLASSSERARELRREFDQFWKPYPHKVGKPAALRSFAKVRKTYELAVILFGLDRYIAEKPPDRPWLNPATFLNQERFNDQPASPPVANGKPRPHDALLRAIAERFAPGDGLGVGQADADGGLHDVGRGPAPDRELDLDLPAADFRRT
jgi:hypothetical protein